MLSSIKRLQIACERKYLPGICRKILIPPETPELGERHRSITDSRKIAQWTPNIPREETNVASEKMNRKSAIVSFDSTPSLFSPH
jgi:hypothetical protein